MGLVGVSRLRPETTPSSSPVAIAGRATPTADAFSTPKNNAKHTTAKTASGLVYSYDKVMTDGITALRWGLLGLFSLVVVFASSQALLSVFDRSVEE